MKIFNKLALVTAITTASLPAQAELVEMNDTLMGETTGQAGVTVVSEVDMAIGSIKYNDDGNELSITNIAVSAADDSAVALTQTIDVTASGLEIGMSAITNLKATIGSVEIGSGSSLGALRIDADIEASTTTIASGGENGVGGIGGLTISTVMQVADLDVLYVDGEFTYDAPAGGNVTGTTAAAAIAASVDYLADTETLTQAAFDGGNALVSDGAGGTQAAEAGDVGVEVVVGDVGTAAVAAIYGAAVFVDSLSTSALTMEQSIDVVDHAATSTTGSVTAGDVIGAIAITSGGMSGNLSIAGIKFLTSAQAAAAAMDTSGDVSTNAIIAPVASLGSISINDFSMDGSTTYIYAH